MNPAGGATFMKLLRMRSGKNIVPCVLAPGGEAIDCSAFGEDWDESFFGRDGLARLAGWLAAEGARAPRVPVDPARLAPPVARPSKIVCIGLNFSDHAAESKMQPPAEPVVFMKATTALCGPNDDLVIPRGSTKTDWEVELAVVVGRRASYVEEADALAHVAGYCLHNDYSEREYQLERCGQWDKGKGCDTFAPLGPFVATRDEVADVDRLRMWLRVNGETMQNGTTANLIFKVPFLVSYLSRFMTLLPGDVISTGTPAGVGLGMSPPRYLRAGDVIELGIDGLGEQRQVARAWTP
jgi:2-keto-4-pentenoate hydratase/2-oxohepta-3-ene-1,7-dioic acid hydratase in catechol pathway